MAGLESTLTPTLLSEVRDFWYGHIEREDALVLPDEEHVSQWFMGGEEFDRLCVKHFEPTLNAVRASGATTGKEILDAAQPKGPLDWLSLVLLLDQMPRNCYRADLAAIAFTVFDPMARHVAAAAIERGIPDASPEIRWFICRRMWFYLPLMHSEDLAAHEQATKEYARLAEDIESLITDPNSEGQDAVRRRAARVMAGGDAERARKMAQMQVQFEKRHLDIIKQFGRYPHRNKALGREPTEDELVYLANGGETFEASPKGS